MYTYCSVLSTSGIAVHSYVLVLGVTGKGMYILFVAVKIASFGLNHTCTVTESHLYCTRSVV